MTKISTIYDRLRTEIASLTGFTGKTELPNPYSLENNPSQFFDDGYGLVMRDASLSQINTYCEDSESRNIQIILVRNCFRLESDKDIVHEQSKLMLEDAQTLKHDLLASDKIGIDQDIQQIKFISDEGIQFVNNEKQNYIQLNINFIIDYSNARN